MTLRSFLQVRVSGAVAALILSATGAPAQTFTDQTVAAGVAFTHHVDWQADAMRFGAGGVWSDYDDDGDLDLFVGDRMGPNALFQNDGAGSFVDVAPALGITDDAVDTTGALWGDYDNDGDPDLYLLTRGDNVMYRNDGSDGSGGWVFTDVTAALGVEGFGRATAAVYGDYDNDGWLDMYVSNHGYELEKPGPGGAATHTDYLFHSVDDGAGGRTFEDVSVATFGTDVLHHSIAHSVAFFDSDNDRDLDLYVVNEVMGTDPQLLGATLWRNDGSDGAGGWIFTDVGLATGSELRSHPMGIAVGDYNNDGWLDFAMSDTGANLLYQNDAGNFAEVAEQAGVDRPLVPGEPPANQVGWGILFADVDLDGFEDLYVATGGLGELGRDQPNPLFINNSDPLNNTFEDVTDTSGADNTSKGRTVVKGDYDGDGDEDLYVVNYGYDAALLRNEQVGGSHLILDLVGKRSNRDAIGSRVRLSTAVLGDQYRMVQSGSTTTGSHELALFYGVTGESIVDEIDIDWPSGARTVLTDVAIDQRMTVSELTIQADSASLEVEEFARLTNFETPFGSHLADFRIYLSVSEGPPTLLGPDDFEVVQPIEIVDREATAQLLSLDGTLQVDLAFALAEAGLRQSVSVRVRVTNLTGDLMPLKQYVYYDWNLGDAEGDQGRRLATRLTQRDPVALPGRGVFMAASLPIDHWEIGIASTLLDKLEQAEDGVDLSDGDSPLSGDLGQAVQLDRTLPAGATWQVVHNFIL